MVRRMAFHHRVPASRLLEERPRASSVALLPRGEFRRIISHRIPLAPRLCSGNKVYAPKLFLRFGAVFCIIIRMNKKLWVGLDTIAAVVLLGAIFFGYRYYQKSQKAAESGVNALQQAGDSTKELGDQTSKGVLPDISSGLNPMNNAPDTNPVSKTNPFSGLETNPFK